MKELVEMVLYSYKRIHQFDHFQLLIQGHTKENKELYQEK